MSNSVYVFSPAQFFGGGEVYQIRLARLLDLRQEFTVVSPASPFLQQGLKNSDCRFIELNGGSGIAVRLSFIAWLRQNRRLLRDKAARIVLNGRGAAYLAPLVWTITGIKPIVIYHTELSLKRFDPKESLYRLALCFAKITVAVSETVAIQHRQRWPNLQILAIPNWIEMLSSTPGPDFLSKKKSLLDIAVVGRLEESKGLLDIIASCSSADCAEVHFYGEGPLRIRIEEVAARLSTVHVHGHVEGLMQRLLQHSVLLSASYSESFSYSVAEGIYAGLLCVISDIPAHRELLGPEYPENLYFSPGDQVGMKAALEAALVYLSRMNGAVEKIIGLAKMRMESRNGAEQARKHYRAVLLSST